MQTYVHLPYDRSDAVPEGADDVRTPEPFVEHFLREFSDPGARVLDPFAGYGTTLAVAEALDREAWGIEYEPDRVAFVRDRIAHPERVLEADARDLAELDLPSVDCCLTSPPYFVEGMDVDPFESYAEGSESEYAAYLDDGEAIFAEIADLLVPDGVVLLDVSNMKYEGDVTTLAWDLGDRLRRSLHFRGEVVVTWGDEERDPTDHGDPDREGAYGYGYDHNYCLVFERES